MDNFLPFSSSNANSVQELSLDFNNDRSHFSTIPTYDHHHHLLPPYSNVACPVDQTAAMSSPQPFHQIPMTQTGSEFGSMVRNPGGGLLDSRMTKMARINRKNAMIRSRNNSSPNSRVNELVESRRQVMMLNMKNTVQIPAKQDPYRYSTFDSKKLRILLVKELKNSDVGTLGRIVLPKREAEGNLPVLSDKEGMIVEMRDISSVQSWSFRYKFWSNNKSRMYVLENTGEFVRENGVEMGDSLTIYEDQSKNLYFSIKKSGQQNEGIEHGLMEVNEMNNYNEMMFDYINEEDASIAMLLGDLNDHYPIPNDLMSLSIGVQATSSLPPVDNLTIHQHVGSSTNDHVSSNDSVW